MSCRHLQHPRYPPASVERRPEIFQVTTSSKQPMAPEDAIKLELTLNRTDTYQPIMSLNMTTTKL